MKKLKLMLVFGLMIGSNARGQEFDLYTAISKVLKEYAAHRSL
jgi:hypothetical protein